MWSSPRLHPCTSAPATEGGTWAGLGAASVDLHGEPTRCCGHTTVGSAEMPARHEQIGQRACYDQAMRVLFQPAIAHRGKAEHPIDDPDKLWATHPVRRAGPLPL